MTETTTIPTNIQPIPFGRYLMCVFYDAMLLFTLLFIATAIVVTGINNGEAIPESGLWRWGYNALLFIIGFIYFAYPWKKGQTLGMKVWKFALVSKDDKPKTYGKLFIRYIIAALSWICIIGILWRFGPTKRTFQDQFSSTYLIDTKIPKKA